MNWGTGIALFYGAFVLSMIGAVFASRKHDPGLVQKNYYELDLNYQGRLEQKQNTAALDSVPQVHFDAPARVLRIKFPSGMTAKQGTAKLYRSAVTTDDFSITIENCAAFEIPAENLVSGRRHVELDWEANGKRYFYETAIFISHIKN
jgi:nitrogen fixation protein FixH